MSKVYKCRPSQILNIVDDDYTAYCFDEACALFMSLLSQNKTPHFPSDIKENATLRKLESGLL